LLKIITFLDDDNFPSNFLTLIEFSKEIQTRFCSKYFFSVSREKNDHRWLVYNEEISDEKEEIKL